MTQPIMSDHNWEVDVHHHFTGRKRTYDGFVGICPYITKVNQIEIKNNAIGSLGGMIADNHI